MDKTLYRKLVESHTVMRLDEENVLLYTDLHLMNEYTSPQAFAGRNELGLATSFPAQNVATVSHISPTHPEKIRIISDGAGQRNKPEYASVPTAARARLDRAAAQ